MKYIKHRTAPECVSRASLEFLLQNPHREARTCSGEIYCAPSKARDITGYRHGEKLLLGQRHVKCSLEFFAKISPQVGCRQQGEGFVFVSVKEEVALNVESQE